MKNNQTDNPFEKILNEYFVGNSYASSRSASSWESNMIRWPHGATTNSGSYERNFINKAKEDEENSKAPPIKPYPLDTINDSIANVYDELNKLKNKLKSSLSYPNLTRSDTKIIQTEIKNATEVIDTLEKMFYNIENISL